MKTLLLFGRVFIDIYRNFFCKRDPRALTAMLLFLGCVVVVTAIQLLGNQLFWLGVSIVAYGCFVALPAMIYIIDGGFRGGRRCRATEKLLN